GAAPPPNEYEQRNQPLQCLDTRRDGGLTASRSRRLHAGRPIQRSGQVIPQHNTDLLGFAEGLIDAGWTKAGDRGPLLVRYVGEQQQPARVESNDLVVELGAELVHQRGALRFEAVGLGSKLTLQ